MAGQDRRNAARDRSHRGNEVLEGRAIGADEVNAHVAVERAQEIPIDGGDDGFSGGHVLEHQFAQVAVALRENRAGRERPALRGASESEDGAAGHQADDNRQPVFASGTWWSVECEA